MKLKERFKPTETELLMAESLRFVRYLPACFDKRFGMGIHSDIATSGITQGQRELLPIIFHKYRKQIRDFHEIWMQVKPDEYQVESNFTLFGLDVSIKEPKLKPLKRK